VNFVLVAVVGYLLGCINGSQIIGKIKQIDIKNLGVKNAGASNTTLVLGWKYGAIVLLIDVFKAIIPILILKSITNDYSLIYILGAFVIVGHNYPITMRFKGGKGTASMIGIFFAIDWKLGLTSLVALIVVSFISDYLVLGVFMYYQMFVMCTIYLDVGGIPVLIATILTMLSVLKHSENFDRIDSGTETTISSLFNKNKEKRVGA